MLRFNLKSFNKFNALKEKEKKKAKKAIKKIIIKGNPFVFFLTLNIIFNFLNFFTSFLKFLNINNKML